MDTSGRLGDRFTDAELMDIDLNLLDIKSGDPAIYEKVTRQPLQPTLDYAQRLSALGRPMWVRYVLVPGLTDGYDNVEKVADICAGLKSVERVEILRFHQMGRDKWHKLGLDYPLENVEPPDAELTERVRGQFRSRGLDRLLDATEGRRRGIRQDAARAAAADGAVPHDRDRLSRRRDQHQGLLARRGRGAVRRARRGLVRAQVGAGADGRHARPRALPLRRRRAVRQAVLPRPDQRGRPQGQRHGADRRAAVGRGEPADREVDGPEPRLRARPVRRLGDQHADAAGGHRDARQRRSRGRLLGLLSVRRRRPDPVPLHRVHDPQAEDRGDPGRRPRAARDRAAQPGSLRQDARRGDERAARRRADRGAAQGAPATSRPRRA